VEEFIEGKELTVALLGNGEHLRVLPVMEVDFSSCKKSGEYFYSWRMKEFQGDEALHLVPTFYCPGRLDRETALKVQNAAKKAHIALDCKDFSRVDIRLGEKDNIPYVLEVNPLPGLDPEESNLTFITKTCGIEYVDLINGIVEDALKRYASDKDKLKTERVLKV
jgi:D-alanine-D-alanine ligase